MSSGILALVLSASLVSCSGGSTPEAATTSTSRRPPATTTTSEPERTKDTLRPDLASMEPDQACLGAFRAAAAMDPDSEFRDRLYLASGNACPTVEDWLVAFSRIPEAAGYDRPTSEAFFRELEILCVYEPDSRLCVNARTRGLIDGKA